MIYRMQLERIKQNLEDNLELFRSEIKTLPEGDLYSREINGKYYYFQRLRKTGNRKKERRISISGKPDVILSLARKRYLLKAMAAMEEDINLLDNTLKKYKVFDENSLMKDFLEKYPELSTGVFTNLTKAKEWADEYEPDNDFYKEQLRSISVQGIDMRSDGEIYIASRLSHFGIQFRYEAKLNIPELAKRPDFTIMRPRDRKIIYWEHFGIVEDDNYIFNNLTKVEKYLRYGIMPWDNFIMSFNQIGGGFNAKLIDCLIEGWLL